MDSRGQTGVNIFAGGLVKLGTGAMVTGDSGPRGEDNCPVDTDQLP